MRVLLQDGCTPLYRAAKNGYDKIVDVLARARADVNAADKVLLPVTCCTFSQAFCR